MSCNNSVNIFLIGPVSSMKTDILTANINEQLMTFAYVFPITMMVVLGLLSNILSVDTFLQAQLRSTSVGFQLLLYSVCAAFVLLLLQIRLIQLLDSITYAGFFSICNVLTPLSTILTRICLWMNGLIAIQRALQSFELGHLWDRIRSRRTGIIVMVIIIICVSLMHVPELIVRRVLPDPVNPGKFICQIKYSDNLLVLNTTFSFIHVFLPFLLNILASCLILASISRRRANIHGTTYWSQWTRQFHRHGHLFVSPTLTIVCHLFLVNYYEFSFFQVCILPQLVLTLKFSCVDINSKWLLRLNTVFVFIIHIPQAATFFLFILPSHSYFEAFRTQSYIGTRVCHRWRRNNAVIPIATLNPGTAIKTRTERSKRIVELF